MYRAFVLLGSTALLLAACHGGGSTTETPMDPMNPMNPMGYRPTPTLHQRAASCAAPVAMQSTRSGCNRTP